MGLHPFDPTRKRQVKSCAGCGRHVAHRADGTPYKHRMSTPTRLLSGPYAGQFQPWCDGVDYCPPDPPDPTEAP